MYRDLDRPPLRAAALNRALARDGLRVEVLQEAPSTNDVLAERARAGAAAGLVVLAEWQRSGRGRLDRSWESPPRAGLTFSVLLRPDLAPAEWSWVPLLAGLAVARALRQVAGVAAVLKWPNDVLVGDRKVAGLLAEVPVPSLAVVGVGVNVTTGRAELPSEQATSLLLEGAETTDRDTLLRAVLRGLATATADLPAGRAGYRSLCTTLGRRVRLELPGGQRAEGVADAVDDQGRLLVGGCAYSAGDVVHLRPAGAAD